MKLFTIKKVFQIISELYFGIFLLALIALTSSFGSFIEQDEPIQFYIENYSKPIYGFINSSFLLRFGLDHVYTTWWFFSLLLLFGISLISCTISRQFPLFFISKEFFFKRQEKSFLQLAFSTKIQNFYYFQELLLGKIQNLDFYLYQKRNVIYGYKGLIGRISPILVHFSLILILFGAFLGAFWNFKVQEILPKGEIFHIQNPLRIGWFSPIPQINIRVNDFWVEYEKNRIHQFYSNLSIIDNFGKEKKQQTISVNNPLRYNQIDFYQSDWNLLGIRVKKRSENKIYEFPLFSLKNRNKAWITWIGDKKYSLIFEQLQNSFLLYDQNGKFISLNTIGDWIENEYQILDILPSTGLLIKYDPSIPIIYLGFGILMITASFSYLPYTQIWIFSKREKSWVGGLTNRGKIQLEIEFENLIRFIEKKIIKNNGLSNKL